MPLVGQVDRFYSITNHPLLSWLVTPRNSPNHAHVCERLGTNLTDIGLLTRALVHYLLRSRQNLRFYTVRNPRNIRFAQVRSRRNERMCGSRTLRICHHTVPIFSQPGSQTLMKCRNCSVCRLKVDAGCLPLYCSSSRVPIQSGSDLTKVHFLLP